MDWLNITGIVTGIITTVVGAFVLHLAAQMEGRIKNFSGQHEELISMQQRFTVLEKDYADLKRDHTALVASQRTQIKNTIIHAYNVACERGYIYATELEVVNRLYENYTELGGNSYVHTIVKRLNNNFEIRGEIPLD